MLDADRQAHHVRGDPGGGQFLVIELAMGGHRRNRRAGLGVTDIDQAQDQPERVVEAHPGVSSALDAEAQDAGGLAVHVALGQLVVLVM